MFERLAFMYEIQFIAIVKNYTRVIVSVFKLVIGNF